jgi:hypothetical protein
MKEVFHLTIAKVMWRQWQMKMYYQYGALAV